MGAAASAPAKKRREVATPTEEKEYEVECIVEYDPNQEKCYKIRWKGYSASNDTWEAPENLEGCVLALHDFWKARQAAAAAAGPAAQSQGRTNSSSSKQTSSRLGTPIGPKVSGGVKKRKKAPRRG